MNLPLILAAVLAVLAAAAHSYLGERYILIRLLRRDDLPRLFGNTDFTRATLRFTWHLTSVAWTGFAGLLVVLASPAANTGRPAAEVVAVTFAASGGLVLAGSRGRHLSWMVFFAIAALVWFGCPWPASKPAARLAAGSQAECAAIATVLAGLPGTEVTRQDGTVGRVGERDAAGCQVMAKGTFGALPAGQRPEAAVADTLRGRGFAPDDRFAADGPDGTAFALRTTEILCMVRGTWEGGDDSDPSRVPDDWFELVVECTDEPSA